MQLVRKESVSKYWRKGGFYNTRDQQEQEEEFEVPTDSLKEDTIAQIEEDLGFLLKSIVFWDTEGIPISAVEFIFAHPSYVSDNRDFSERVGPILTVRRADPSVRIVEALRLRLGLHIVQWLHETGNGELSVQVSAAAASVNDLKALKYLRENSCPWDEETTRSAILHGSFECLQFAREHGCPMPAGECECMRLAAVTSVEMVQCLQKEGEKLDVSTMNAAASVGKIDIMQHLHEQGCPWDASTTHTAALHDHLECLKYAHQHGCPWDNKVAAAGLVRGHWSCLAYTARRGCALGLAARIVWMVSMNLILFCLLVYRVATLSAQTAFSCLFLCCTSVTLLVQTIHLVCRDLSEEFSAHVSVHTQQRVLAVVPYLERVLWPVKVALCCMWLQPEWLKWGLVN